MVVGRREVLAAAGAAGVASIAGCTNFLGTSDGEANATGDGAATGASYSVPSGTDRVEAVFRSHLDQGLHHGAQLAVYREGEQVVDLAGGTTGPDGGDVSSDQRFLLFSCTKPLAAATVHHLLDEGTIALDDRLVDHWPAFADEGSEKAQVTVRHALSHQAGLPAVPIDEQYGQWTSEEAIISSVEDAELQFTPGETARYHLLSFGWILLGLVRKVTDQRIDRYAQEHVFDPLGMDRMVMGLPEGEPDDVATLTGFDAPDRVEGRGPTPDASNQQVAQLFNQEFVHRAVVPAANGLGTASDLARFYQVYLNGGSIGDTTFVGSDLVDEATSLQVEADYQGTTQRYGLGFVMGGGLNSTYGISVEPGAFGHAGLGTSTSWADPDLGLTFAYVTNGIRDDPTNTWRLSTLSETVRDELG
jgi:CubicO group peptidase (beta-lactamase class C family)